MAPNRSVDGVDVPPLPETSKPYKPILLVAISFLCGIYTSGLVGKFADVSNNDALVTVNSQSNGETQLPNWVSGTPEDFATEMLKGSKGLTDKTTGVHKFQYIYQPNLARLIKQKMASEDETDKTFRIMEYGLGCAPGGGMINGSPGGSAFAWRHLFDQIPSIQLELHLFEYDKTCALKWKDENPHVATMVHTGDASSEEDLNRSYNDAGKKPFDVIIDDASHINWHMIKTLDIMLPRVATNGFYLVEDISSACTGWSANLGTGPTGEAVGGDRNGNCMKTLDGKDTILAHLMEYQRILVGKRHGYRQKAGLLHGVTKIELQHMACMLSKEKQN